MLGLGQFQIIREAIEWEVGMKMMILGALFKESNSIVMLALIGAIIQYALGLMLVLFYVAKDMLLQCIGENENMVIANIALLPISEALKEQLSEQMHCIAQYYRERIKR